MPTPTITIRQLDDTDAARFKALRVRAIELSPTSFLPTRDEENSRSLDEVAARIRTTDTQTVFGAFDADTLIGITGVRRETLTQLRHKATVWGVFVDPAFRGRGIAQRLLDAATAHAADVWHCVQVTLGVNANNDAAKRLYVAQGFVRFGTEPRATLVDGRFYDEEYMVKTLK
ncbi:GNAT family N-acetyltransferase [Burkholderia guangdongensis]|uniref:GNAT family N-acetyltransferase n=1 Tax=Burkholderia guangdongensis TaxID=1792500 RepID=UPI0015CD82EE|nr:GNAT family protein [Burkholderia guangdongensis]